MSNEDNVIEFERIEREEEEVKLTISLGVDEYEEYKIEAEAQGASVEEWISYLLWDRL